jgi:hypothetical protein
MTARSLAAVYTDHPERCGRDRLEVLTALINGPSFDPMFREMVIRIPRGHPIYRWECIVADCERTRSGGTDLCNAHLDQWVQARSTGVGKASFVAEAQPLGRRVWIDQEPCRLCPGRPAASTEQRLCQRHNIRWYRHRKAGGPDTSFEQWLASEQTYHGFGECQVTVCPSLAATPLGLCSEHEARYDREDRPGQAGLPTARWHRFEQHGQRVPVVYANEEAFRAWCAGTPALFRPGQVNLRGVRPLLRAEIQYTLFAHTQQHRPGRWDMDWVQKLINLARQRDAGSLTDLDLDDIPRFHSQIAKKMLHFLRLVYFTPDAAREAGFLETEHFGVRFADRASHVDLTAVPQLWLRDLLWDHLADLLRSPGCPRTALPVDNARRGITELAAFVQIEAPAGGHDPALLTAAHMQRFVADQRRRSRDQLPSLVMKTADGNPSTVTVHTRSIVFNSVRKVMRWALETGEAERLGLSREFIVAMPFAGGSPLRARRPFPDTAARALADEANLARLAEVHDPEDQGMRDVWEAIVLTGRRVNEILQLRWDCIGHYGGLPMFWHDQTVRHGSRMRRVGIAEGGRLMSTA